MAADERMLNYHAATHIYMPLSIRCGHAIIGLHYNSFYLYKALEIHCIASALGYILLPHLRNIFVLIDTEVQPTKMVLASPMLNSKACMEIYNIPNI